VIKLGDTVRWFEDLGVVFRLTEFNGGLRDESPAWHGCVVSVRWQNSPNPTVHIFYSNGDQGFGFPIALIRPGEQSENT
jgi:hypothetical protein